MPHNYILWFLWVRSPSMTVGSSARLKLKCWPGLGSHLETQMGSNLLPSSLKLLIDFISLKPYNCFFQASNEEKNTDETYTTLLCSHTHLIMYTPLPFWIHLIRSKSQVLLRQTGRELHQVWSQGVGDPLKSVCYERYC